MDIVFDGIYFEDKKWDGEVKIYDDFEKLKFCGKYKNGKIWEGETYVNDSNDLLKISDVYKEGRLITGNGEEYYENGKLKYKGKFVSGKRHGQGTEYNEFGKPIFSGEYQNGERFHGLKYDYLNNNLYCQSRYSSGVIIEKNIGLLKYNENRELIEELDFYSGRVVEYLDKIKIFEGEYIEGKRHKGKEYEYGNLVFDGEYIDGKRRDRTFLAFGQAGFRTGRCHCRDDFFGMRLFLQDD